MTGWLGCALLGSGAYVAIEVGIGSRCPKSTYEPPMMFISASLPLVGSGLVSGRMSFSTVAMNVWLTSRYW